MSRSTPSPNWKTQAQAFGQQLWANHGQARWRALTARERLLATVFLGLISIWLFVSIAITPAMRTLSASAQQRAEVAQQVIQMRALQQRAQELQKTKPLSRDESLRNLQNISPVGNPSLQTTLQGDRVLVQLKNLSASQLASWLAQARIGSQALPDEVHISRSAGANVVSSADASTAWDGQIVLRLPQRQAGNANVSGIKP